MRSSHNGKAKHKAVNKRTPRLPSPSARQPVAEGQRHHCHAECCSRVSFITLEGFKKAQSFFSLFYKGLWWYSVIDRGEKRKEQKSSEWRQEATLHYTGAEDRNNLIYLWKHSHYTLFTRKHNHASVTLASTIVPTVWTRHSAAVTNLRPQCGKRKGTCGRQNGMKTCTCMNSCSQVPQVK